MLAAFSAGPVPGLGGLDALGAPATPHLSTGTVIAPDAKRVMEDDRTQLILAVTAQRARQARREAARDAAARAAEVRADRRAAAAAAAAAASATPAAPATPVRSPVASPAGNPQHIAYAMLGQFGWSGSQFGCLVSLWNAESGWNPSAANPDGAYGIPQALPGSKMASAGPDWQTNPATQIRWGLGYIRSMYGSPCGAWAHEQGSGWY